jgi:hypothetical protein
LPSCWAWRQLHVAPEDTPSANTEGLPTFGVPLAMSPGK